MCAHLLGAGDDDPDRSPAGGGLERRLAQLGLDLGHLGLHLLRHLGELTDVHEYLSTLRCEAGPMGGVD